MQGPQGSAAFTWCPRVGLCGLLLWLCGGLVLEALHGFKLAGYLDDELRREMWTLAHAHGTLLAALCLLLPPFAGLRAKASTLRCVDRLLAAGALLVPCGFALGGVAHGEADPSLGILLVPAGALLFAAGVLGLIWTRRA